MVWLKHFLFLLFITIRCRPLAAGSRFPKPADPSGRARHCGRTDVNQQVKGACCAPVPRPRRPRSAKQSPPVVVARPPRPCVSGARFAGRTKIVQYSAINSGNFAPPHILPPSSPPRAHSTMRLVVKINCCKVPKYSGERLFKLEFRGKWRPSQPRTPSVSFSSP